MKKHFIRRFTVVTPVEFEPTHDAKRRYKRAGAQRKRSNTNEIVKEFDRYFRNLFFFFWLPFIDNSS